MVAACLQLKKIEHTWKEVTILHKTSHGSNFFSVTLQSKLCTKGVFLKVYFNMFRLVHLRFLDHLCYIRESSVISSHGRKVTAW